MQDRTRVGEILLQAGIIDQFQLKAALGEQARWGRPLGATLVKLGFVEESELVRALASQLNLPVASLEGKQIHQEVLDLVPVEVAEKHMVIPLFVKKQGQISELYLGMEDPCNLEVMDDLVFRTGMRIKAVMVCPSDLWEGIDRYYRREKFIEPPKSSPQEAGDDSLLCEAKASEVEPGEQSTAILDSQDKGVGAADVRPAAAELGTEALVRHWSAKDATRPVVDDLLVAPAPAAQPFADRPKAAPEQAGSAAVAAPPESADTAVDLDETETLAPSAATDAGAEVSAYDAKTRMILHALTQILIDKGVMTREEIHTRVSELSQAESASD